jgi:transcriptional regulator with XRE-family HTH domain
MNGDELRQRREGLGMTQEQLAKALGVNTMTVSRWERGVRSIPPHLTLALEAIEIKQKKKSDRKAKPQK